MITKNYSRILMTLTLGFSFMQQYLIEFYRSQIFHQFKRMEMYGRYPLDWEASLLGVVVSLAIQLNKDSPAEEIFELWKQVRACLSKDSSNRLFCEISQKYSFQDMEADEITIRQATDHVYAGLSMLFVECKSAVADMGTCVYSSKNLDVCKYEKIIVDSISRKYDSYLPTNIPTFYESFSISLLANYAKIFCPEHKFSRFNKYVPILSSQTNTQNDYSFLDNRDFHLYEKSAIRQCKHNIQTGFSMMLNTVCPEIVCGTVLVHEISSAVLVHEVSSDLKTPDSEHDSGKIDPKNGRVQ